MYLALLQKRSNTLAFSTRTFILTSFFWVNLTNDGYERVATMTDQDKLRERVGVGTIFDLDTLMFPIHIPAVRQRRFTYTRHYAVN